MAQNTHLNNEYESRIEKLARIKELGINPYLDKFERTCTAEEAKAVTIGTGVRISGRIMLMRNMGKLGFCQIQDQSGRIQICLNQKNIEIDQYKFFFSLIDIGDFVGVEGDIFMTNTGEPTVQVKSFHLLSKSLRPLPDKWLGLKDVELKYRQRYLDLVSNNETFERFKIRSAFIKKLRDFYHLHDFIEVDTPVLSSNASGAMAKPFITHYNALDQDVYLRIAPELYLKQVIIGGFEKIFEVARVFRNEGMDASHLQEFTMIEHYAAYWNYQDNISFTEKMIKEIATDIFGSLCITTYDRDNMSTVVDLSGQWPQVSFRDLILKDCGIDINKHNTTQELKEAITNKGIEIRDIESLGRGNLIDSLYKKVSRPKLINPIFITDHPIDLSPLARKKDGSPMVTDRFQLVINGWEIVNAYSELIDPIDQARRFDEQSKFRDGGDEESMLKDDDYVRSMEYGMPPISGWGMGVERILALFTGQKNLRDVILFPLLKSNDSTQE
jgi:lysyl-tRNA synthetase, class II